MNLLRRIWTGIVAAVAGAALAVLVPGIGLMFVGWPIDYLKWILLACVSIGFLLGMVIGPRQLSTK